jgi:hypothetical protein
MLNSGKKFRALCDKKINILTTTVRIFIFFVAQQWLPKASKGETTLLFLSVEQFKKYRYF